MSEEELAALEESEEHALKTMDKMQVKDSEGQDVVVPSRKQIELIVEQKREEDVIEEARQKAMKSAFQSCGHHRSLMRKFCFVGRA